MIEVTTAPRTSPDAETGMLLLYCRAPFLLPPRIDKDPVPCRAGDMLTVNQAAMDESDALGGALVALISLGAVMLVRPYDVVLN